MKKILLTIFISIICILSEAQTIAIYKAEHMSRKTKSNYGWSDWGEIADINSKIVFDFIGQTITFSDPYLKYKMTDVHDIEFDEYKNAILKFECVESYGNFPCSISIVTDPDGLCLILLVYPERQYNYFVQKQ